MTGSDSTWLPRPEVEAALNPHLLTLLKIEPEHEVRLRRASELLSAARLDVMAKFIYAQQRVTGSRSEWGTHVYREHLRIWNEFREGDDSGKRSFEDYRNSFDQLLDNFGDVGFDENCGLLPVDSSGIIIDGSHRLAAALTFDCPVKVVRFGIRASRYDYRYFRGRGLGDDVLDDMFLQYCRFDQRLRVAVLFPVAKGRDDEILSILHDAGPVAYRKAVTLTYAGRANLVRLLYRNEPWLGAGRKPTPGLTAHVSNRFVGYEPVKFIFFVSEDDGTSRELKNRLRALFDLGNDSVHINDRYDQTISIAESILNTNSIHFMNYARPAAVMNFATLLRRMKEWIADKNLDPLSFCIDGSAVLAAYGLRDARDLDYLHSGDPPPAAPGELIACHNEEAPHYGVPLNDLVLDPRNYFYSDGMKFLALGLIRTLKLRRSEAKDLGDVYRIDSLEGTIGFAGRVLKRYYTLQDRLHNLYYVALHSIKRTTPPRLLPAARALYRLPLRLRDSLGPDKKVAIYRGFELHYSKGTSLIEWIRGGRVYEPAVSQQLIQALKRSASPICLDVGANIGLITLNVLAEVPDTRVIAFEPGPHQAGLFQETINANRLDDRVSIVRSALGREAGSASFAIHRSRHASGDGFYDTHRAGRTNTIEVPVMTLDDWWDSAGKPRVDAIKVDTEGAELWVLQGGERMLHDCHPSVVFELHPQNLRVYPYDAINVVGFLEQCGYAVTTLAGEAVTPGSLDKQLTTGNDYVATCRHD